MHVMMQSRNTRIGWGIHQRPAPSGGELMNFYVDTQSEVPIFRQLMDQVKLHIANGQLKPGDELMANPPYP